MPHPKHRSTSSSRNRRRAHHALSKVQLINCKKCKAEIVPHRVCASCGTYAGRQVLTMQDPTAKVAKPAKATKPAKAAVTAK